MYKVTLYVEVHEDEVPGHGSLAVLMRSMVSLMRGIKSVPSITVEWEDDE